MTLYRNPLADINTPRDIATALIDANIDILLEAKEINKKRYSRFQDPLPLPEFNVPQMLEKVKELARTEYNRRKGGNEPLRGTANEWVNGAASALGEELLVYAKQTENTALMESVWNVWSEYAPKGWNQRHGS